jgi:hypothetical protein
VRHYLRHLRDPSGRGVAWGDMPGQQAPAKPTVEGWTRQLEDGRLEIFVKVANKPGIEDLKIRASGPTQAMFELVDWFEERTGLRVSLPGRLRTGPKPIVGQTSILELESGDA